MIDTQKNCHDHNKKMSEEEEVEVPKKTTKKQKPAPPLQQAQPQIVMTAEALEAFLKQQRKEWDAANANVQKEDDVLSVSSITSTSSTKSTQSMKDNPDYLTKTQRMYILQAFTMAQLRNMTTKQGRPPTGSSKKELVYSAVNLVKTKSALIDFILSSNPEDEDSDE